MKFFLRFAPTLLLVTSVLAVAQYAAVNVSAKPIARSEDAQALAAAPPRPEARQKPLH